MRFAYASVMFLVWVIFMASFEINVSNDIQVLSTAIIVAGALAGGD